MSADVAMTKKGFGEMAITATLAGPVFNTLVGISLSNFASYAGNTSPGIDNKRVLDGVVGGFFETQLKFYYREWLSISDREKGLGIPPKGFDMANNVDANNEGKLGCFDKNSMVPIIIMSSQMFIIGLVLFNGVTNSFKI